MIETDDNIVRQLLEEYFSTLPRQIKQEPPLPQVKSLVERRKKIERLLKDGYGIGLGLLQNSTIPVKPSNDQPLESSEMAGSLNQQQINEPTHARRRLRKTKSQIHLDELEERSKSREKLEVEERIADLRADYSIGIPQKLASCECDVERQRLTTRRTNIRILLERGYKVCLKED